MRNFRLCPIAFCLILASPAVGLVSAQTFPVANHPVGLQWTGSSFIASYRDGTTRLLNVSLDGSRVEPFAPAFSGQSEVYIALSPGEAGFPPGHLYLCTGGSIYATDSNGSHPTLFTNLTSSVIEYVTFDYTGQWGYNLLALGGDGQVWALNSSGAATRVSELGNNLMPEGVTVAPPTFGAYGGDLIVSMEKNHKVVAISKSAPTQNTTLAVFPGEAPERVLTIPVGLDLYVAKYDQGVVERFGAGNFTGYTGSILVITEGESGQTGSLSVLTAQGPSITVKRIYSDPNSPHFEGAAFAPEPGQASYPVGGHFPPTSAGLEFAAAATLVLAVGLAAILVIRWSRRSHPVPLEPSPVRIHSSSPRS